jgi:hypothetical protein
VHAAAREVAANRPSRLAARLHRDAVGVIGNSGCPLRTGRRGAPALRLLTARLARWSACSRSHLPGLETRCARAAAGRWTPESRCCPRHGRTGPPLPQVGRRRVARGPEHARLRWCSSTEVGAMLHQRGDSRAGSVGVKSGVKPAMTTRWTGIARGFRIRMIGWGGRIRTFDDGSKVRCLTRLGDAPPFQRR